uniref:Glycerophosphocholine phosphodiesterase 1 n=1 Tax=Sphenodon punctatus TaxID=8508 RepID=A0A8D0HMA2_SPHPU
PQSAVVLQPSDGAQEGLRWKTTVELTWGVTIEYRYFKGIFLEPKTVDGPCQVLVHKWETHLQPRSMTPLDNEITIDNGQFGIHSDVETLDSGWLTCQTEIRLRLHYSEKPPVSITKKKFKKSRFRVKLTLEGLEEEGEDDVQDQVSPIIPQKMANTLEISMISDTEYRSRHSQPECGYALQPDRWTEYSIQTMEPDNLELIFDFFEEDLSEAVVQGDELPGHVGSACLLSSTIAEQGRSVGILTLPIMSRSSRKTIGKVRGMLDTKLMQENTIASLRNAASHGAAFVEFDVHLSKDHVPIVYHDLTCCMAMKKKFDAEPLELFEIPVKELTFDQLQLLKVSLWVGWCNVAAFFQILECLPQDVGFNIEIKWICQQRDGIWDGNLSVYFDMNLFLDIILKTTLINSGRRRIIFSSFDADICTMVRQKQNKYPVLFLTQGKSDMYPELMDLRCRTTPIAMSFAQFENLLGISAHAEDLLRNPSYIQDAKSKGLVIFCWGDDTNDPENRKKLREYGVHGLIYDRIYDWMPEQPNIFQIEQLERLKQEVPELKSCICPTVSHFSVPSLCMCRHSSVETNDTESVQNV